MEKTVCRHFEHPATVALDPPSMLNDAAVVIIRRRLVQLGAELRSVATDVLGAERSRQLWGLLDLPSDDAPRAAWAEQLPALVGMASSRR